MSAQIHTWEAFTHHWRVWRFCGLLPPPKNSAWRLPYLIYAGWLNLSVTLLFPVTLVVNCCLSENLNDFCESLYVTITDVICNLKFLNVFIVRRELRKVRPILERLDLSARSAREVCALRAGMRSAELCFTTFFRLYSIAVVTSQLVVYLSPERMLMYPAWFPWDWQKSRRNFLLAHSYQLYGVIVQTIQNLGNDTYPQAYLTVLTAHVNALALRIRHLGTDDNDVVVVDDSRETKELQQQRNYGKLVSCIKDHQIIIQLFFTIQNTVSTTCLAQFVCTGLAQCTLGVYMLYVGKDYSKLLNILIFFWVVTMETFILCYYGDLLCQANENLTDAIYACNWMDQSKDFKKALLLLLQRAQKINVIMAGNLIPMRLPTFVQVKMKIPADANQSSKRLQFRSEKPTIEKIEKTMND